MVEEWTTSGTARAEPARRPGRPIKSPQKPKKETGQKEMLLPIAGKKPKGRPLKKTVGKSPRKSAWSRRSSQR
jgi:hypothetical protein